MFETYGEVAAGLKACLSNMGPWSLGDLTLGIRHVGLRHDSSDVSDRLPGRQLSGSASADTYSFLRQEIRVTKSAYSIPKVEDIVSDAQLPSADDVLHVFDETAKFQPAFFVAKDSQAKVLRVVVRGTKDMNDVLTDMAGDWVPLGRGSAHKGMLQAAEWLLEKTVPLVEQLPKDEFQQYRLRFSGHSLGAGTAALATHLLHTTPSAPAYRALLATFPLSRVDCFCASPPPVLSLELAHAAKSYATSIVLDHDVVARASLANFEQLRLEVLSSGWWKELTDPVVKSSAFQKVAEALEKAGAQELIGLAWQAGEPDSPAQSEGRKAGDSGTQPASKQPGQTDASSTVTSALAHLHQLYAKPTTKSRAAEHDAAGDRISKALDTLMESHRASSSGWQANVLSKFHALSQRPKHELAAVSAAAAGAAWVAWSNTKPFKTHDAAAASATKGSGSPAKAKATARGSGTVTAQPVADSSSPSATQAKSNQAPANEAEAGPQKSSFVSTVAWLGNLAVAGYAAASAASSAVSTAADVMQALHPSDLEASTSKQQARPAKEGQGGRTTRAAGTSAAAAGAAGLGHLDDTISSVRLYAPGRLLHLQRIPGTTPDAEVSDSEAGSWSADGEASAAGSVTRSDAGVTKSSSRLSKPWRRTKKATEQFVLVDGDPVEARFEFIAVRQTWITDHFLGPMLDALQSAEAGVPVSTAP